MFTVDALIAHAVGDYVLQSDWMATEKVKRSVAAAAHALCYTVPFLFLTRNPIALAVICSTHFVIDRWRLARYVCWAKNFLAPRQRLVAPGATAQMKAVIADAAAAYRKRNALAPDAPVVASSPPFHPRRNWSWAECVATGYGPNKPPWMAVWLLIITDNLAHVICNAAALHWWT